MANDAYRFLIPSGLAAIALLASGWFWAAVPFLALTLFVAWFFRNPDRAVPAGDDFLVSPADGRVIQIEPSPQGTRLSIFLSVFDVHVNRAPIGGRISRLEHRPGRFLAAFDERASVENEQMIVTIEGSHRLTFSLIAGLVARRIVPWKAEGETVAKGDRIGLIRFGSRVDLFLPSDCRLRVAKGDRVRAGSTVIAHWMQT